MEFLCKVFEKKVYKRLVLYLEKHALLSNIQCAFLRYRATLDHHVTFLNLKHVGVVSFDITKAYDRKSQGSVLSVSLFLCAINSILDHIHSLV